MRFKFSFKTLLKRRPRYFGIGTASALVLAAIVLSRAVGNLPANAEQGAMPKAESGAPVPLWKPEPGLLLSLRMDPGQRSKVVAIDMLWRAEKQTFLSRMKALSSELTTSGRDPRPQSGLQEYSELSRAFDTRRGELWAKAESVLRPDQEPQLDQLRHATGGTL